MASRTGLSLIGTAVDDIHRQLMKPGERAFEMGQIIRVERVRNDHARFDGTGSHRGRAHHARAATRFRSRRSPPRARYPGRRETGYLRHLREHRNRPGLRSGARFRMSSCRLPSSEVAPVTPHAVKCGSKSHSVSSFSIRMYSRPGRAHKRSAGVSPAASRLNGSMDSSSVAADLAEAARP